ncbi:MAG: MBL fold metallo-hydrolase [Anaerovoracaceae bacterium]|jgi:hydroxyacylglutathione hydrolase
MMIKKIVSGCLESNGYIIFDKQGGEGFVIDPGDNAHGFIREIKDLGIKLKGILLTHHHYDHVGAVEDLRNEFSSPVALHGGDLNMYKGKVDLILEDGDQFPIGNEVLKVIHTPGHTRGGVCYYSEESKLAFTGDTIFNIDLGRTDLADGSPQVMGETIRNIISKWEDDIVIYPGHGDSASMDFVRKRNQEYLDYL